MIRLGPEPIALDDLVLAVQGEDAGAIATFLGTVRNENLGRRVLRLEYDAYPEMAEAEMRKIAEEAVSRRGALRVAIAHRTGTLELGEISVAIAVAAAHRAQAIEACRFAIDTLKRTVPIWKKEIFEGGEVWIEGEPPR